MKRLLPGIEFETAIETIEIISAKTEDKQMCDQREKAQRDFEWAISGAREEGRGEGERWGLEKGKLTGLIQSGGFDDGFVASKRPDSVDSPDTR